jgi:hypothetical protein
MNAKRTRQAGSVTLLALCFSTAMGIAVASYLALCSRSNAFSMRALYHSRAQEFAQIGLEEALWAINRNSWSTSGSDSATAWTTSGTSRTTVMSFALDSQAGTAQVTVTIDNFASAGPTWPTVTSAARLTLGSGQTFNQTLRADLQPAPLFAHAIASAASYVSFTTGGTVDSWNSDPDHDSATAAVPYAFTAGNAANYNAVVASGGTDTFGVTLGQATVRGYVATVGRPVSYSVSGSPPGSVVGPATPAAVKVDTARLGKSAFIPVAPVFEVVLPATSGPNYGGIVSNALTLASTLLSAPATADVFETSGDLSVLGVPLISPSLTFTRPTKLIVRGNLTIAGSGRITVSATGSLELFVTGDITIGADGFQNQTGEPRKLAVFSTAPATANPIRYTSTADFCGVVYAENCPIDIRQNATFYGALLSRDYVRFSTSATAPVFHYDSALRLVRFDGVSTPYVLQAVTEL